MIPQKNFQSCWKGLLTIISVTLNAGICLVDLQKNAKTVFSKWVFTVSGSQLFIIFSSLIGGPVYYACHINFSYVSISFSAFVFESFAI